MLRRKESRWGSAGSSSLSSRPRQFAPGGTTNYAYQASTDRIAQATGAAARHYAHDAFGNRIWAGPAAYAGQPSHVYDQGNRLIEVRDPVTQAVLGQYTYDAAGRRVRKIAGGVTTLYFYDSAGHLVEEQKLSTSPAKRRSYVFVEDEPMGIVDQPPSGSPVFSWIHTDRLGTPLAVTSTPSAGSEKVIWRATYEPFGLATPDEDPDGDSATFALDLRLPGQVFDAESGGHDNYFRSYDPALGRFLEADPIGIASDLNLYAYVGGRPTEFVDPLGLEAVAEMSRRGWGLPPPEVSAQVAAARSAFWRNYEDMRAANWKNADKYFHCKANCEAAQCGDDGRAEARALSDAREWFDRTVKRDPTGASSADQAANRYGRDHAKPGVPCQQTCAKYRPPGLPSRF